MLCKPDKFVTTKGLIQLKKFEDAEMYLYSLEEPNTIPPALSYLIVCRSLILARSSTFLEIEQDWVLILENYHRNVRKVGSSKFSSQFVKSLYKEVWRQSVTPDRVLDEKNDQHQHHHEQLVDSVRKHDFNLIASMIERNEKKSKIIRSIKENNATLWTDTDENGHTLLHKVVISGKGKLFEMMVNKGKSHINFDQKDNEGKTLFHWAAEIAHYKICEILLQKNVPIMALSNDGLMPVHYLVRVNRSEVNAEIANFRRIFLLILQAGFDVNSCDHCGNSVLHFAAQYSSQLVIKCILEEDCDIDLRNNDGETALHIACRRNSADIARLLLNYGASHTISGKHGTAKKIAISERNSAIVRLINEREIEENKSLLVASRNIRTITASFKKPSPSPPIVFEEEKQHDFIIVENIQTAPYLCQYCYLPIIVSMAASCVVCSFTVHQGNCNSHSFYLTPCSKPIQPIILDLSVPLPLPLYISEMIEKEERERDENAFTFSISPSSYNLISNVMQSVSELFNTFIADFVSPEKSIQEVFGTIFEEKELHCLYLQFLRISDREGRTLSRKQIGEALGYTLNSEGIVQLIYRLFEKAACSELIDFTAYVRTLSIILRGSVEDQLHLIFSVVDEEGKGYIVQNDFRYIVEGFQLALGKMHLSIAFDGGKYLTGLFERLGAEEGKVTEKKFMEQLPSHLTYTHSLGTITSEYTQKNAKSSGMGIIFGHDHWDLAIHLMLGIRQSSSEVDALPDRPLRYPKDFSDIALLTFSSPRKGYVKTWEFSDYARRAYRKLREFYCISQQSYQYSLGPERILGSLMLGQFSALVDVVSTGRSGSFFFKSVDSNYLIKTLPPEEHSFLLRIMPDLVTYQLTHKNSLLPRIVGVHSLKANIEIYNFIVMGNVFASPFPIDEQYDLKGSKVNRWVEVEQITPQIALKDLNFKKILKLGSKNKALFLEQLERDCKFLEERNICDYSLLVGIHSVKEEEAHMFDNLSSSDPSIFRSHYNGILSSDRRELYFFGIIDVLTTYNLSKFSERTLKSIIHYNERMYISAMSPLPYRLRFQKYVSSILI